MTTTRATHPQRVLLHLATLVLFLVPLPGQVARAASQPALGCDVFDSRIWAQSVYDDDPAANAALDPDQDDLACEDLPLGAAPALWTDAVPPGAIPVELASVSDGDTIDVVANGRLESVRLVGVDAPESGDPYREVECFGLEGTAFLEWLLASNGHLFIEQDLEDRDHYGRLLRWAWLDLGDGEVYLLNEAVIRAGHAERFRDTPNRRYVDELIEAEEFARFYGVGLWGACETGYLPVFDAAPMIPPTSVPPTSAPVSQPGAECDPAYPDVCIPSPPPDLQCRDVPYSRFRVLPPDPHNFDGNFDGVACEGPG
jgi:micrococcal nuclease